jgi:hypothetical protein
MGDPFLKSVSIDGIKPVTFLDLKEGDMTLFAVGGGRSTVAATFYVGVDAKSDKSSDQKRIHGVLGFASHEPLPVGLLVHAGGKVRLYGVSEYMPDIVRAKYGKKEERVGPNCIQAALVADGYKKFAGRYVSFPEFDYYLRRDYEEVPAGEMMTSGALVVYGSGSLRSAEHVAYLTFGAHVFQKGGWLRIFPYEIVPLEDALDRMESHSVPKREDRFKRHHKRDYSGYTSRLYRKRASRATKRKPMTKKDKQYFLPLFKYYIQRFRGVMGLTFKIRDKRLDLTTVKNIKRVLAEFAKHHGSSTTKLLSINEGLAEMYHELKSLSINHDGMLDVFDPINGDRPSVWERQYREVYTNHYLNIDAHFHKELWVQLKARGITSPAIYKHVLKRFEDAVAGLDIERLAKSKGGYGQLDYEAVFEEAITAAKKDVGVSD